MRSVMKIGLGALFALGTMYSNAFADVNYFYTGTDFTIAQGPYTTSDSVTGSITLSSPLGSYLFYDAITPVAFSFSDGVQTLTQNNTNNNSFTVSTDAAGDITAWIINVAAEVSGVNLELVVTANAPGYAFDLGTSAIVVPGSFVEASTSIPGTWSAGVVPETSTWIMMAVGFAGLGCLVVGKRKALHIAPALS
jgi:hypothetical protein